MQLEFRIERSCRCRVIGLSAGANAYLSGFRLAIHRDASTDVGTIWSSPMAFCLKKRALKAVTAILAALVQYMTRITSSYSVEATGLIPETGRRPRQV